MYFLPLFKDNPAAFRKWAYAIKAIAKQVYLLINLLVMTYNLKLISRIAFSLTTLIFISCGDDDEGLPPEPITNFEYMPLEQGNNWQYEVETGNMQSLEEMRVERQTGEDYEMESDQQNPEGLMTNVMTGGTLTISDNRLLSSGSFIFDFQGVQDLNIDITDAPLYDQNQRSGTLLYTKPFFVERVIQNFDTDIEYSVSTVQLGDIASLEVNGTNYDNVIHSQLIINARIGTVLGSTTVNLLEPQNIIIVDNFWAENVGLIKSDTTFSYQLEDLSGFNIDLMVPQAATILTTQDLLSFTVN
jgi:hypothetical protein